MKNWIKRATAVLLTIVIMLGASSVEVSAGSSVTDQLIVLPSDEYNVTEAQAMIGRLEQIPANVLETLNQKGVKIKLTNDIITNMPELSYLKGVVPRGWENTGLTWDDVPGVSEKNVIVRIGFSKKGKGHNTQNLELHETMHAVDRYVFNNASSTSEFKNIFNQEANIKYKGDGYVSVYPVEYFAETATLYIYSEKTRAELKDKMPLTYEYMNKLFNS